MELKNKRGRPVKGMEGKTVDRKVRLEPRVDKAVTDLANRTLSTRAAVIREAIIRFLRQNGYNV